MKKIKKMKERILSVVLALTMVVSVLAPMGTIKVQAAGSSYNYTELVNGQIIHAGDTLVNDISSNSVNINIKDRNYDYYGSIAIGSSMVFENSYAVKDSSYRIK